MATVQFFEKPGCRNNTRQKALLQASGHGVEAYSILAHPWTTETLRPFFGNRPVAEWFNPAAPRVRSGAVDPAACDGETALALMLEDPLLIRRPLMAVGADRRCGFDPVQVDAWIGLKNAETVEEIEACPNRDKPGHGPHSCHPPSAEG